MPQTPTCGRHRALPAREEATTIRADALPTCADPASHDNRLSTRTSTVPPAPHGTQAHTHPSQRDPALTAYPPATAQSSDGVAWNEYAATAATSTPPPPPTS